MTKFTEKFMKKAEHEHIKLVEFETGFATKVSAFSGSLKSYNLETLKVLCAFEINGLH